jgi:hypothetical protein
MRKISYLALCFCAISLTSFGQVNLSSGLLAYYPFDGSFADVSGKGNNGTGMNGVTFGNDRWGREMRAAYFDGVNDWINVGVPNFTLGHRFTIAFLYNTNNARCQCVMAKANYIKNVDSMQFQIAFNHPSLAYKGMFLGTNHTGTCKFDSTFDMNDRGVLTKTVVPNQWSSFIMIFDNGVKTIYLDGALAYQDSVQGKHPTTVDSCGTSALRFGMWWTKDTRYYSGLLDEVRIYNRALNAQEVTALSTLMTTGTLGTKELSSADDAIKLSPNPANDQLIVTSEFSTRDLNVTVRTVTGQVVRQRAFASGKVTISTGELPSGMYFVEVGSGEIHQTFKVQVQH